MFFEVNFDKNCFAIVIWAKIAIKIISALFTVRRC